MPPEEIVIKRLNQTNESQWYVWEIYNNIIQNTLARRKMLLHCKSKYMYIKLEIGVQKKPMI